MQTLLKAGLAAHRISPRQVYELLMCHPRCVYYSSRHSFDTWDGIRAADASPGKDSEDHITLLYSRYDIPVGPRGQEATAGWSREHIW